MSGTRRKPGELGPHVEGYRAWLAGRGYTPETVRGMLKDLGEVGRWMSREGLREAQLDEAAMVAFLAGRVNSKWPHRDGPSQWGQIRLTGPNGRPPSNDQNLWMGLGEVT